MMGKGRVEAFSDGVLAIILTIMVLELKVPRLLESQVNSWESLVPLLPIFMSYLLSFIYVGIYWTNHNHLLHATHRITGSILWANMHLLFWLSLIPFTTALVGLNHLESMPTALYGVVLLLTGLAFWILEASILKAEGPDSALAEAVGNRWKEAASLIAYTVAIGAAFLHSYIAIGIYVLVAIAWLVPDRRIERVLKRRWQQTKP